MEVGFVKIQINVNIDGLRLKEGNSEQISVGKGPHGLQAAIRKPPGQPRGSSLCGPMLSFLYLSQVPITGEKNDSG